MLLDFVIRNQSWIFAGLAGMLTSFVVCNIMYTNKRKLKRSPQEEQLSRLRDSFGVMTVKPSWRSIKSKPRVTNFSPDDDNGCDD